MTTDKLGRAEHAEQAARRDEVVNAARTYERCLACRHAFGQECLAARRRGEPIAGWRDRWDAKSRDITAAGRILTGRLGDTSGDDWSSRAIVDGVLYLYVTDYTLIRVVLAELDDWGQVADRRHPGREAGREGVGM